MSLADHILDCLASGHSLFQEEGGQPFEALTETDLMAALRERGWRLPPAGFFMSDVRAAGFTVKQGYEFSGKVRRAFCNGGCGRALSQYQTIIFLGGAR